MQPITAYKTQDGKIFESKELAQEHEFGQMLTDQLDAFSQREGCPYPDGVANQQMRKSIIAWERAKMSVQSALSIDVLELPIRSINVLKAENIYTIRELISFRRSELMKVPNMGRKSLDEIIEALRQRNLELSE